MIFLTEANRIAAAEAFDEIAHILASEDEIVETNETIDDFISSRGKPDNIDTAENGVLVHEWNIGKKTLCVADFGEARAALVM